MKEKFTLLKPIHEEKLQNNQSISKEENPEIDPSQVFEATISQFSKFAVGNYFWFIADPVKWIVPAAGGSFEKMFPMKLVDLVGKSPEIFFKNVHPEDIAHMFAFSEYWVNYLSVQPAEKRANIRATVYIRNKSLQSNYYWAMVQYVDYIFDDSGKFIYGLTLVTDISSQKKEGIPLMSILNTEDQTCQHFVCTESGGINSVDVTIPKLTAREVVVLRYLAAGYSSKQIASDLHNSINTINNHRQNLLQKTNTKSSAELINACIKWGYV